MVTGNSPGWVPSLVEALAEAGADVAVVGLNGEERQEAVGRAEGFGRRAVGISVDLTRARQVRTAVEESLARLGHLDILVNGAQTQFGKPFTEVTEREWDRVMALNLKTMFLCCQEVGRVMLQGGGGRIVNIISGLSERGLWSGVPYCASQGAALQLTRALGLEWAWHNIRVNAIATGWFTKKEGPAEGEAEERLIRYIPSRRRGHPRDIGALLVYLASDACDFVTGTCITVDGGLMAHP